MPHSDALLVSASWLPPAAPAASAAPARVPAALQSCFWLARRPSSHSNQCARSARRLARRSPPLLGVLLGVSCASAQTCAAERRLMLTGVNDFPGIHTPFPCSFERGTSWDQGGFTENFEYVTMVPLPQCAPRGLSEFIKSDLFKRIPAPSYVPSRTPLSPPSGFVVVCRP